MEPAEGTGRNFLEFINSDPTRLAYGYGDMLLNLITTYIVGPEDEKPWKKRYSPRFKKLEDAEAYARSHGWSTDVVVEKFFWDWN